MKNPKTSIFILTKNAGKQIYNILNQVSIQKEKNFEVIIIDSGSTDDTLEIAKRFNQKLPLKVHKIKSEEFGFGKTRNLALKLCKGKYIVYINQDALPYNNKWLSKLLENFKDEKVAGVYSKQIPRKNSDEIERFYYRYYYPDKKIVKFYKKNLMFPDDIFFSNVSSAVDRDILQEYKFNESLIGSEDQEWAKKIIIGGYKTVYEPCSIVIHSHNYNLKQIFQRYFTSALALRQIEKGKSRNFVKKGSKYLKKEFKFIVHKRLSLTPKLLITNLSRALGTIAGIYGNNLPFFIRKQFSLYRWYWANVSSQVRVGGRV